ncbi:putative PPPDE domain-containing peptidase [Hamiltosporidium tvaerminnensis]|uniref:Putative PPPDE domain-containing peptidase n=3 Tax=Hamiltosporidium TaxID=1176354 RepID=A0A4Q9LJV9_9MICR|nr:putative PPPDE domain-containing peptidase [Hamiltosporidium magnivora]TBU13449.1 putative PPPDE domain-containing peptidase [Hamiltosporidium tvaerminnensis]
MSKHPVILRVYDLSKGQAKILSLPILGIQIEGIWHTSVEVYQREYYFQDGILHVEPVKALKTYDMGITSLPNDVFHEYLEILSEKYNSTTYDLFKNNCNHFSNDATMFLLSKSIPTEILDLPEIVMKSPMYETLINMLRSDFQSGSK